MVEMSPVGIGDQVVLTLVGICLLYRLIGYLALAPLLFVIAQKVLSWHHATTLWKRLGIPMPPMRWWFFGHVPEYKKEGTHKRDVQWSSLYGKIYGTFYYTQPELIVSDPQLLRMILVKDFQNFPERRKITLPKNTLLSRQIGVLKGDDWKRMRTFVSPMFTSKKLKRIVDLMQPSVDTLCEILGKERANDDGGIDVSTMMSNFTIDLIAAAAFSMQIGAQLNKSDDIFARNAKKLVTIRKKTWRLVLATSVFPWLVRVIQKAFSVQLFLPELDEFYIKYFSKTMTDRRSENTDKHDFMQLMMNTANNNSPGRQASMMPSSQAGLSILKSDSMGDKDIIAQCILFFNAGYEATAATLSFASYLLAHHPEIQDRCMDEIRDEIKENGSITFDSLNRGLQYLDAVISETLRLFPPGTRLERTCDSDYPLTDELTIPKDTVVIVPIYAMHHSSEFYENPEKFDPERFFKSKTVDPLTYLPFGYGPRNCVGLRLAHLEVKLTLCNILKKFTISPCAATAPMPLDVHLCPLQLKPKRNIRLSFVKRSGASVLTSL